MAGTIIRNELYVKGTGTFEGNVTAPNITAHIGAGGSAHAVATTSVAGFMSASDKLKLDGVESGANNYSFPGLTGHVTTSAGAYATTIQSDVITNAMINSSAAIATSKLADGASFMLKDGSVHATGDFNFGTHQLKGVADPTLADDAATKGYVDSVATGLSVKPAVRVATTTNIGLSGLLTIDGVTLSDGDRVLVKNQTNAYDNGIYVASSGAWSRATDADQDAEVRSGMYCFVTEGTSLANSGWILTTANPIEVGVTNLTFEQFSSAGQVTPGVGLDKTGTTLFVKTANSARIAVSSAGVDIASTYVGQTSITTLGTITTGTWQSSTAPIGAAYGGTGITSYTKGDLLYASGGTTLSKLADIAVGNVLLSGGIGADPSYGKVLLNGTGNHITGILPVANGGTGASSKSAAFDALSPMTTLGDIIYGDVSGTGTRLGGNTSATKMFLSQTGTGSASATPAWSAVSKSDVGLGNVENTSLSSWGGSSNIVTVGLIQSGTWGGIAIAINKGGTGLTTAPASGQLLIGNSSNGYTLASLTQGTGITITSASGSITIANAGVTSINGSSGAITNVAIVGTTRLDQFASTTSAQLRTVISDTTGTGNLVFATSPTLTTPTLGVATATSINKVSITAPATSATLALANGSTLATAGAYSITLTAGATTNVTLPASGTLLNDSLLETYIYVGNSSNKATGVALSGDATITNTGTLALVNTGVSSGTYNNVATEVRPFTVDSKGRITGIGAAVTITPAWSNIASKPTTISGFGITDAYTKTEIDNFVNAKLNLSGGTMSGAINMNSNNITNINRVNFITGIEQFAVNKTHTTTSEEDVFSLDISTYKAFIFEYNAASGNYSSARTGQFMIATDGANIQPSEISTSDIGDTSGYVLRAIINAGYIVLKATAPATGWKLRGQVRTL